MKSINIIDQIKASRKIYAKKIAEIESMSDTELSVFLASASSDVVARALGIASSDVVDRVLGIASSDVVARVLASASSDVVARVLGIASAGTVDRVLSIASAGTVDRVLGIASYDVVARVLASASSDVVARVLGIASYDTVARITSVSELVVPIVDDLDEKVAEVALRGNLDMSSWHCGTTHCRAGWAIMFGGEAGAALEDAVGPAMAGRLIYEASTGRLAPNFFASNEDAMADILACAARKDA